MTQFVDRVVVITGAAQGIGQGVARRFAREGATVVVADINEEAGTDTADSLADLGGQGLFMHYDLFDFATGNALIEQTENRFGKVDVLVNNAYPTFMGNTGPMEDKPIEFYQNITQGGYLAIVALMNAAFPGMKARNYGRIINMCSLNGVNAHKYTSEYNACKEAVRAYSRTAATPPRSSASGTAGISPSSCPPSTGSIPGWACPTPTTWGGSRPPSPTSSSTPFAPEAFRCRTSTTRRCRSCSTTRSSKPSRTRRR